MQIQYYHLGCNLASDRESFPSAERDTCWLKHICVLHTIWRSGYFTHQCWKLPICNVYYCFLPSQSDNTLFLVHSFNQFTHNKLVQQSEDETNQIHILISIVIMCNLKSEPCVLPVQIIIGYIQFPL